METAAAEARKGTGEFPRATTVRSFSGDVRAVLSSRVVHMANPGMKSRDRTAPLLAAVAACPEMPTAARWALAFPREYWAAEAAAVVVVVAVAGERAPPPGRGTKNKKAQRRTKKEVEMGVGSPSAAEVSRKTFQKDARASSEPRKKDCPSKT